VKDWIKIKSLSRINGNLSKLDGHRFTFVQTAGEKIKVGMKTKSSLISIRCIGQVIRAILKYQAKKASQGKNLVLPGK
jgi:hypothetical protein